jgi:hypothetical protein
MSEEGRALFRPVRVTPSGNSTIATDHEEPPQTGDQAPFAVISKSPYCVHSSKYFGSMLRQVGQS